MLDVDSGHQSASRSAPPFQRSQKTESRKASLENFCFGRNGIQEMEMGYMFSLFDRLF